MLKPDSAIEDEEQRELFEELMSVRQGMMLIPSEESQDGLQRPTKE
jgi:hypothetical protein